MPYTALPDRRMPYDNDGTVAFQGAFTTGPIYVTSGATLAEWNDNDFARDGADTPDAELTTWLFFPEQREVTAIYSRAVGDYEGGNPGQSLTSIEGSNDTTNGLDGTWETATLSAGVPGYVNAFSWREGIKPVSFTGGKRTIRFRYGGRMSVAIVHLYGEKVTGQTPDDLIYIDHDTTPGAEYQTPEDFGDRPLGTTVVRQFRVKNASATKTANTINVQCNDADFAISTDSVTWVVTISIASLGPGAESATLYVRNTTPNPGNVLGPRYARIVSTVASYT